MENGDIVTACSDGVVRIWTVNQNHFAGQRELDLYTSQLSINKSMHKKRKLDNVIPLTSVILFR
jgi:phospholipase A-2-activating protein